MRIESVSAQPDRAGRYRVNFSDGSVLRLYRQTVQDFGIYTGKELSEQELQALKQAASRMSAKMRAVRIVSASSVSRRDLRQRLIQKGEDAACAEEAVSWMEQMQLVDDRNTARQVVSRCVGKGYGISRAKQALYEKKIPREYWQEALADYPDQSEHIREYIRTHLPESPDQKSIKKVIDALLRKGHSYSDIRRQLEPSQWPED